MRASSNKEQGLEFGSSSEDVTRLSEMRSLGDASREIEKKELQFGSLDFTTVKGVGPSSAHPSGLLHRQVPTGTNEFQFGSLDFATLISLGGPNAQKQANSSIIVPKVKKQVHLSTRAPNVQNQSVSSTRGLKVDKQVDSSTRGPEVDKQVDSSTRGLEVQPSPDSIQMSENSKIGDASVKDNLEGITKKTNSNGSIMDFRYNMEEVSEDFNSITISENKICSENQLTWSNLSFIGDSTLFKISADSETVQLSKEELQKVSKEKASVTKHLLPRGLINSGNLCFLNATLQALLACSPFVQLLQELRQRSIPKIGCPTLRAFVEFICDFDMPIDASFRKNEKSVLETGMPFTPFMFEPVLKSFTPDLPATSMSGRPRQEDAQEFLSFVMDQMHDELLKLEGQPHSANGTKSNIISSMEDDDWEIVGPRNKSAVTRTQSFIPSELSKIFGGQLRSVVKARGNKASATVQPYLLLHLDIFPEAVHNIEDALRLFSAPESLEGYKTSVGKAAVVSASKSVKLQTLSKVMILHMMRFGYGSKGSTKLHKPVRFPLELVLGRELLVSPSAEGRRYELVATITHHGREPSKGHYTADVKYPDGLWLHYDDASVTVVGPNKVLHDQAYVLFYRQL
ncbi:ubiquitin carboxyl-terminal hydrolase 24 [Aristolochia californica]|uniref:ubiquitin carboxyl-terminal hydrolase 24 n=1 Tax=Aristolochia californica TaxID=171875 RepID=UPI0035D7C900